MKKWIALALLTVTAALLVSACRKTEEPLPDETDTPDVPAADWYALSGDGKTLTVRLRGNATTGYLWSSQITGDDVLLTVSDDYTPDPADDGIVGVGGFAQFVFRAADGASGTAEIRFAYVRPWESGMPAASHALTVSVSDDGTLSVSPVPDSEN